jgi:hypothetical protein
LFEKAGAAIDEDRVSMPWDDAAGTNKGYVMLSAGFEVVLINSTY